MNMPIPLVRDSVRLVYKSLVSDQSARKRRGIAAGQYNKAHVASPDVIVDHQKQRIVMFYHGQRDSLTQLSRVASSSDGIKFIAKSESLPSTYLRSFQYQGNYCLLGMLGVLMRSDELMGHYQIRNDPLFDTSSRHLTVEVNEPAKSLNVY